ncbi:iron-containing alcohol dehydrogenase [Fundicoccus culcitae]|uniref:Iron-containing alcohol dehydrogenase n=1 Tax=Fundicoccus culcitae TaxID=2969821 RepID=A0ABY5P418_9LACT|nr:iron-containing alcohol dehydrogenase [Fundicoccus culcitae]UUX33488.1 iron-containing alcohol dehydrogenase [Fundicoccus culcitae]
MSMHKVEIPTEIFYGDGCLASVGELAKKFGDKVLIIGDEMMGKLGHIDKVTELLEAEGLTVSHYLGVNSEPNDGHVSEGLAIQEANEANVLVAIGGGSPIDTAKAIAVVATNGGYIGDYLQNKTPITQAPLPLIAIPTTAGTGSEVTNVTVITNTQAQVKMMIKNLAFLPKAAIIDPNMTMTSPQSVTAATGMDALCHGIESYISRISHPLTKTFSMAAIELILNNIQTAYDHGDNVEARTNMALGAMEAGIAFSNASVTLVHGMSRPVGALFHVPHGISNSMLLPAVLEFTRDEIVDELADIARLFLSTDDAKDQSNDALADETIAYIKKLSQNLNIPNLKDWGIDAAEFEGALDKMATDAIASGSPGYNPRIPSHQEVVELYRTCYDYDFSV